MNSDVSLALFHACAIETPSLMDSRRLPSCPCQILVSFLSAGVKVLRFWEVIHEENLLPFFLMKKYINCAIGSC